MQIEWGMKSGQLPRTDNRWGKHGREPLRVFRNLRKTSGPQQTEEGAWTAGKSGRGFIVQDPVDVPCVWKETAEESEVITWCSQSKPCWNQAHGDAPAKY